MITAPPFMLKSQMLVKNGRLTLALEKIKHSDIHYFQMSVREAFSEMTFVHRSE
jgi:hypothetical protein